jgi:hypothetical protein
VVLVLLHRLFAFLTFYSHRFGILVKGRPDVIVRNGQCDTPMMWRNHASMHDLDEDMRLNVHKDDLSGIRIARGTQRRHEFYQKIRLTRMTYDLMKSQRLMRTKKRWIKPTLKTVPIFFECTCYAGAV